MNIVCFLARCECKSFVLKVKEERVMVKVVMVKEERLMVLKVKEERLIVVKVKEERLMVKEGLGERERD